VAGTALGAPISFMSAPTIITRIARSTPSWRARCCASHITPEAIFWIQDYHFLILGAELRRLGIERPLGFFLHTPWADRRTMTAVPHHGEIARAMLAYDLIGFQTVEDRQNSRTTCRPSSASMWWTARLLPSVGLTQLATFPIGIDVDDFAARATKAMGRAEVIAFARKLARRQARPRR
jgi:trehalose 6-phosphate synthase